MIIIIFIIIIIKNYIFHVLPNILTIYFYVFQVISSFRAVLLTFWTSYNSVETANVPLS